MPHLLPVVMHGREADVIRREQAAGTDMPNLLTPDGNDITMDVVAGDYSRGQAGRYGGRRKEVVIRPWGGYDGSVCPVTSSSCCCCCSCLCLLSFSLTHGRKEASLSPGVGNRGWPGKSILIIIIVVMRMWWPPHL